MLGKVARWLVLMGYDASFVGADGRADAELLKKAQGESRVFLTRDTRIPPVQGLHMIMIREQDFEWQLKRIFKTLGLRPEKSRLFTRCTWCNKALELVPKEEALPLVPPLVRELKTDFWRCPGCKRMYWSGSHTERTVAKLERMGLFC